MTDEQAVRQERARQWLDSMCDGHMHEAINVIALLDAKDGEIVAWKEHAIRNSREADAALSRAEQAERERDDERKAHQTFREEVSEAVENAETVGDLFHFILPTKPADPHWVALAERAEELAAATESETSRNFMLEFAEKARAKSIERAGGVKAVFEEGSDYDNLPQCIKSTEFTAGRRAGGTISFEGEG